MKKVLVTGGMGFVGGHLVKKLLSMGLEVIVIDRSIYKPVPFKKSDVEVVEADLQSRAIIKTYLTQVDTCFHLAALSSLGFCNLDWIYSHQNNVLVFNTILDVLHETNHPLKLIYASSSAVYGNSTALPLTESDSATPISGYGGDKLSNEIYAKIFADGYNIPSIGLRLFNVYGPGQMESNPYSGVITLFKKQIYAENPLTIYGSGEQTRDFIFVEDVVDAFIKSAAAPASLSGIFNVCSGTSISIKELALLMMEIFNIQLPIIHAEPRVGDLLHSRGNGDLAAKTIKFIPQTTMLNGLKFMMK